MKGHDPERDASRYLSGGVSARFRRRFEAHMVDCPDCWHEVRVAGIGRGLAESGRELAPQRLRDRVRGSIRIAASRAHERRWRPPLVGGAGLALAAFIVAAVVVVAQRQPDAIELLVADFGGDTQVETAVRADLPPVLGDLELTATAAGGIEGMDVVVHRYRDTSGHRVAVYRSDEPFPVAQGAIRDEARSTWHASVDGVEVFCAEEPFHALVIGGDRGEVAIAVDGLALGG